MIPLIRSAEMVHKHLRETDKYHHVPYDVNDIRRAVFLSTTVDSIVFRPVMPSEADAMGFPLFGRMKRFEFRPSAYAEEEKRVVVEYHDGLPPEWKQFSIVKELAQIFCSEFERYRSGADDEALALVQEFVNRSHQAGMVPVQSDQMHAEEMAIWLAAEILCPFEFRDHLLPKVVAGDLGVAELATTFGMPETYCDSLFDPRTHQIIKGLR